MTAKGTEKSLYYYDNANRLTGLDKITNGNFNSIDKTDLKYDDNGNLTEKTNDGNSYKYSYDAMNRMDSFQKNSDTKTNYAYNAFNQRILKYTSTSTKTDFIYDRGNLSFERKDTNPSANDTIWFVGRNGRTEGMMKDTGSSYRDYLYDGQGNVASIYSRASTLAPSPNYDYDAYGNQKGNNSLDKFSYRGYYKDSESGLFYLNARYYDSTTGQFTQQDPVRCGNNWYSYCDGEPINRIDPSGCCWGHDDVHTTGTTVTYANGGVTGSSTWTSTTNTGAVIKHYSNTTSGGMTSSYSEVISGEHCFLEDNHVFNSILTAEEMVFIGDLLYNNAFNMPYTYAWDVYSFFRNNGNITREELSRVYGKNYDRFTANFWIGILTKSYSLSKQGMNINNVNMMYSAQQLQTMINNMQFLLISISGSMANGSIKIKDINIDSDIKKAFGSDFKVTTLSKDTTVYRYYGGDSYKTGNWYTPYQYSDPKSNLALSPGNTAQYVYKTVLPAGTIVIEGTVAPQNQWGLSGGGYQYYVTSYK